jgi:integrase
MAIKPYIKDGKKLFLVEVKVRDPNGKQLYRSRQGITSERKANDIEFELKKELESVAEGKPRTNWESWLEVCISRMKLEMKASTWINYQCMLKKWVIPHWKTKEMSDLTKSDVHTLIFETIPERDMSLNTRKTILKMVKRIFQMALEDGLLDRNPCVGISVRVPEVEQKVFTNDEVSKFLYEAKVCQHRFYPIWVLALMTGMRSGELFALEWSDIDLNGRTIRVNKQWTNKTGFGSPKARRNRTVPVSDDLAIFLKELKLKSERGQQFVLPRLIEWENGEQALVTREFCESIDITPIKFHDLRATFITNLLARGVSLARVMAIVGHSQLKTTNGYLRKAGVDLKGATEQLGYQIPKAGLADVISIGKAT